jgi:hypothetical protein
MRPIVYLDSSDYSVLSDPSRETAEVRDIREQLLAWVRAGSVDFRYSQVHISEMAPTREDKIEEAVLRVGLLCKLCGPSCLIGYWEVLQLERLRLERQDPKLGTVFSNRGEWFTGIDETVSKMLEGIFNAKSEVVETLNKIATSRAHLRASEKLIKEQVQPVIASLERDLPLRPGNGQVFGRYMIGNAPERELRKALDAAVREPVWMIRWLHKNFESMGPALSFLRGPSTTFHSDMTKLRKWVSDLRRERSAEHFESSVAGIDDISNDSLLIALLQQSQSVFEISIPHTADGSVDLDVLQSCAPGLLAALKTSIQVGLAGTTVGTPRKPLGSDFLDVFHTFYAPYVHVFRADRYMAPIVQKSLGASTTQVVGSIADVVPAIERLLSIPSSKQAR